MMSLGEEILRYSLVLGTNNTLQIVGKILSSHTMLLELCLGRVVPSGSLRVLATYISEE